MDFSINTILAKLKGGGARPSLFSVQLISPFDATIGISSPYLIKAAALPASSVGEIPIGFMGRKVKAAGDRSYADWQVTVINDEDFAIRESIESWSNAIQGPVSNLRNSGANASFNYKAQATITQYGKAGDTLARYTMFGMWPKEVGAIELAWDQENTIESFPVTFAIDYFLRVS